MVTSSNVLTPAQNNSFGVYITKQGRSEQQFLKRQKSLRGRIDSAQIRPNAGKLNMPQDIDKLRGCVGPALLLCDNAF